MQNPLAKIKKSIKNAPECVSIPTTAAAVTVAVAATYYLTKKKFGVSSTDDVIIPAKLVAHMKTIDGAILGVDTVKGYDILVKLIPVQS